MRMLRHLISVGRDGDRAALQREPGERHSNELSRYILPSSSGMIGVCMTFVGLIKLLENGTESRQADECVAVVAMIFFSSATLSYFAIRIADRAGLSRGLEKTADVLFAAGLFGIVVIGLLFAFNRI